jgi:hypothetical protein
MKPYRLIAPFVLAALALAGGAARANAGETCTPTNIVFYSGDTANLATALNAAPASCTEYWISITPKGDGTPRPGPIATLHGMAHMHGMAELRPKQWSD